MTATFSSPFSAPNALAGKGLIPEAPPRYVEITPKQAAAWLEETNTHNRSISDGVVSAYSRDMAAEPTRWKRNGESIKFGRNPDGTLVLVDGQHRLAAIVKAGVPVWMLVVHDVPLEFQDTVDIGRRRSYRDVLNLNEEKHYVSLAAVLRRIALWDVGSYVGSSGLVPTAGELNAVLLAYPEVRVSVEFGATGSRAASIHPSVLGFSHWLLSRVDPDQAEWFLGRVVDGAGLSAGHPALTLRERMRRERDYVRSNVRKPANPDECVCLAITAWNIFRRNKTAEKLMYPKTGLNNNTMPMPK